MASFEARPGGWLARVRVKGFPARSEVFRTKAEARAWAARVEADIAAGKIGRAVDKTFGQLLKRFIADYVPNMDGHRQETLRLNRVLKDPIADVALADLDARHVSEWRDRRLKSVSAESVLREWSTLSRACTIATKEWRWIHANPFSGVEKPSKAQPRTRRISQAEIDALLLACGYERDSPPTTKQAKVGAALLFAIETAMRAGEICHLRASDIAGAVATVAAIERGARKTKTARRVPLSREALRIIGQLKPDAESLNGQLKPDGEYLFGLSAATLDALFRKAKARALIDDVHFHDSRREALTRMAAKVDVLTLAKISGHQDLRILQRVYYAPDIAAVADALG